MNRNRRQSQTFALIFSLLIVLSGLSAVNLPLETEGAESTRGEPTRGEGNTWYVDDDAAAGGDGSLDKPYQKIQDAINYAADDDTILVFNGTYYEYVLVYKRVNLIGNGSSDTTINGSYSVNVVKLSADHVSLSGFTITGSGEERYDAGLRIESDHNHVFDIKCIDNEIGIYVLHSDNVILTNISCSSNNSFVYGIRLEDSNHNNIANNTFHTYYGISIEESSSYNIITNNTCTNNGQTGIKLSSSSNNVVSNNTCSNQNSGISVSQSTDNVISHNTCLNNSRAISLTASSYDNLIENNTCVNFTRGIYLRDAGLNNVINNNCSSDHGDGIFIDPLKDYNFFSGNSIEGSGIFLNYYRAIEYWLYAQIDSTNTVNGKPVYYYKNSTGLTVPQDAGQVILANCSNMVIENLNCSDASIGILVGYSHTMTIANNTCSNVNGDENYTPGGIIVYSCSNIIIENNSCSNNVEFGISIDHGSTNCTLINNTCNDNLYTGISLGYYVFNNTLTNNTCHNNGFSAISISGSDYNTITNNTCTDTISLYSSDHNTLTGNNVSSNGELGFYFRDSDYNIITNNNCSFNNIGIHLTYGSDQNIITRCTISRNEGGIFLEGSSSNNTVQFNNIFSNRYYGINASNSDGFSVDAAYNWWGYPSGPYHPEKNPDGKGNNVSDNVNFDPWSSEPLLWETLFVAKSGNDSLANGTEANPFLTIQKAVDESNHGDTIRVFEGVYEENVVVDKSVEIIGNGSGETVIQGFAEGDDEEYTVNCSYKGGYGGFYYGIVYEGGYLYATHFQGLSIFNVSDSSNPEEIGFIPTAGKALGVALSGGYAYVADDENGMVIVNVSDPVNPTEEGHYDTAGEANAVAVSGGYAYVADATNGLVIVDISDPGNPTEEGHFDTAGYALGVAVSGGYAYIADRYNGLVIVDIRDPANPTEEGHHNTTSRALGVVVNGDYAYVADRENGLVIVDISDPGNPMEEGHFDTAGYALGVAVSGEYAYVVDWDDGLVIINVSDPANPTEKGHYDTAGYAEGVVVSSGYAYVADGRNGLVIVDIIDKENPTRVGHFHTAGSTHGVAVNGDFAYVADGLNGLVIIDISDPGSPTEEGYYDTAGNAQGVAVSGEYAYVADYNKGLVIVNISDPGNPMAEGHYDTAGSAWAVVVSGGYAYIADFTKGLAIVDISNPTNPKLAGYYDTISSFDVAVSGDYAYMADGSSGLVIVDIGDPENPTAAGHYDTAGSAHGVAVNGDYAYVADWLNGLVIADISDPRNPMEVGHYDTARAKSVTVSGDYAYVADSENGLVVIDVSNPTNPTEEGHYNTTGFAESVTVSRDYAYVADGDNGLVILELHFSTDATLHISGDNARVTDITVRNGSRFGVLIDADDVEIERCLITGNNDGIKIINGSENVGIHNCNIIENNARGINSWDNDGKTVDAIDNWWGHPSGPLHSSLNPDGKGNEVSDDVEFEPWLSRPIDFRILHVSSDGNDLTGNGDQDNPFGTIQKAIDLANEWDTIEVASGTYAESIVINKRNVTIFGDSPETTILDADGTATTCTIIADNVELNGFTVINGNENGILIIDSSGNRIVNCVFPDNSYDLNLTKSRNNQLINATFETVNFNDSISSISVQWPIDLKVTDNRSGFISNAHLDVVDTFGTIIFNGYTNEEGRVPQMLILEYYQNISTQIDYNPYTISIWKSGYLDFTEDLTIESYSPVTCELQTHIFPQAIILGEMMRYVDMDSQISFDGRDSSGRSITYYWEFGDTTSPSTSRTPSHTFTSPGAYQVNLTVTDDYDNTSVTSIIVIVDNVIPIARADSEANSIFEDEAIDFDAPDSWDTSSDTLSFLWDFGDGFQSENIMPTHSYEKQGLYDVSLTAIDMYGGESSTHLFITVMNKAPWDVSAGGNRSVYTREIVDFQGSAMDTISDIDNLNYIWDFGDGMISEGQDVDHSYSESGMHVVNLTVIDNDGASSYSLVTVTVKGPEIVTSVSSTSIFQDEEIFLEASHELDDGSFIYTWYFGDGLSQAWNETYHTYYQSGIFSPYLIIHDGFENITVFVQEIVVNNVIPTPHIEILPLQISEDESLLFDASNSEDSTSDIERLTYVWDFGDGTTDIRTEVNHAFSESGSYSVQLFVSDGKVINSTQVEIHVENVPPTANAGIEKEMKATEGNAIILDASLSQDTDSDLSELNYTWKIGEDRVYGRIVGYTFDTTGSFPVVLEVRDNNGAVSEDALTFEVSKSTGSDENDDAMNAISWILVVIMIVFLGVIGFLIHTLQDEKLFKEMKAEERVLAREMMVGEEAIVVEGVVDEESFKPKDEVPETIVQIPEGQDAEIVEAEVEVEGEGEVDNINEEEK